MFKTALSSLSSTIVGATKRTLSEFAPTQENIISGAFNNLAQQGIANLSYRSPGLATLAQSALQNFQLELLKKQKLQEYVKSDKADWLRPQIKSKLGPSASSEKIEAEMTKVISKISAAIDRDGVDAVKKAGTFKEYEKFFDEFKKSAKEPKTETQSGRESPLDVEILTRIEGNTNRTVNVLEELVSHNNLTGGSAAKTGGGSFIDPMTGMPSITAAVGSIGGSLLSKVFDEKTLDKFASKAKKFISQDESPIPVRPKTPQEVINEHSSILSARMGGGIVTPDNTSEAAKELDAETNAHATKLQSTSEESLQELVKIREIVSKEKKSEVSLAEPKKESVVDKALGKAKDKVVGKVQERIPKGQPGAGRFTKPIVEFMYTCFCRMDRISLRIGSVYHFSIMFNFRVFHYRLSITDLNDAVISVVFWADPAEEP